MSMEKRMANFWKAINESCVTSTEFRFTTCELQTNLLLILKIKISLSQEILTKTFICRDT